MKVVIVAQSEKRHVVGRLGGGIMAVERMHAELLAPHAEVHLLLTLDSEDIYPNHPKIKVHQVGVPCEEAYEADGTCTKHERGQLNRKRTQYLEALIRKLAPDIVINHSFSSSQLKMCTRLAEDMPVLTFLHCVPEAAADMSLFSKLESYARLTELGSELVCVSKYQRDRWREKLDLRLDSVYFKMLKNRAHIDEIFSRVCYSTAANPAAPVNDAEDYFIMIGRPESDKNIGKVLEGLITLKRTEKVKVYIAFSGDLDSYPYYLKNIKPWLPQLDGQVELCCNRPRVELLDALSKSKALIVAMLTEASPVAPIEALSSGVGTIMFCGEVIIKGKETLHHACFDVLDVGIETAYIPVGVKGKENFLMAFQDALNTADAKLCDPKKRKAFREAALQFHSADQRTKELLETISEVRDKYAKPKQNTKLLTF